MCAPQLIRKYHVMHPLEDKKTTEQARAISLTSQPTWLLETTPTTPSKKPKQQQQQWHSHSHHTVPFSDQPEHPAMPCLTMTKPDTPTLSPTQMPTDGTVSTCRKPITTKSPYALLRKHPLPALIRQIQNLPMPSIPPFNLDEGPIASLSSHLPIHY